MRSLLLKSVVSDGTPHENPIAKKKRKSLNEKFDSMMKKIQVLSGDDHKDYVCNQSYTTPKPQTMVYATPKSTPRLHTSQLHSYTSNGIEFYTDDLE